jgi:hypothetical protein
MLNVIDPARYAGAGTLVSEANRGVAELAVELLDVLSTSGQVAGRGHGAGEWSQAYDRAAATVAAELAHLVDALGSCVLLLDASGHNHARAEAAAAPYGLPGSALSRRRLRAVSAPQLPEAYGGNEAEPHGWSMLATHLGFYQWPGADIGRLRALAAAWQRAATALREAAYLPRQAAAELTYLRSPELPDAIAVSDRLGAATLTLADDCADLGASCSAYADRVLADRSRVAHEVEEFVAIAGTTEVVGDVVGLVTDGAGAVLGKLVQSGVVARYVARITALLSDLDLALPAARPALAAATDDRWLLAVADSKPVLADIDVDGAVPGSEVRAAGGIGADASQLTDINASRLRRWEETSPSHTISRHVGRSVEQLRRRVDRYHMTEASSFTDVDTAASAITQVLREHQAALRAWLADGGNQIALEARMSDTVGTVVRRSGEVLSGSGVRVVLRRAEQDSEGFRIHTAFVIP